MSPWLWDWSPAGPWGPEQPPWGGQGPGLLSRTLQDTACRHPPTEGLSALRPLTLGSPPLLPPGPCRNPGAWRWTSLAEPASPPQLPFPLPPRASTLHPALLGPAPGAVRLPARPGPLTGSILLHQLAPYTVRQDLESSEPRFPVPSASGAALSLSLAPPTPSASLSPEAHPQLQSTNPGALPLGKLLFS